jgi:hypothetical protein
VAETTSFQNLVDQVYNLYKVSNYSNSHTHSYNDLGWSYLTS